MSYLVIARKYRPRRFDEVAGQPAVARTIKNAIELDRVAHAYLFSGPRGVGKTSMARILARSLCCEKGPTAEPCDTCSRCESILRGNDLDVVEIDAASNRGIDDIRALREKARVGPMRGQTKLYIIDEVHQLTSEAFNALLKTLEEPPAHVVFVLATTEPERLPDTIRSRCQCFEFSRVAEGEIIGRLRDICVAEEIEFEEEALAVVARAARGGMRDSQSLLDQLITFGSGKVTVDDALAVTGALSPQAVRDLTEATLGGDLSAILIEAENLYKKGIAPETVIDALLDQARELMVVCAGGESASSGKDEAERGWLRERAAALDIDRALAMVNVLLAGRRRVAEHDEPRLPLEATLLRLGRLSQSMPIAEAIEVLRGASVAEPAPRSPGGRGAPAPPPRSAPSPSPAPRAPAPRAPAPPIGETPRAAAAASPADRAGSRPASSDPSSGDARTTLAEIVAALRETSGPVGAFLAGFQAVRIDGDVLEVRSNREGPGLYNLGQPKVRGAIAEVTTSRFGRPIEVRQVAQAESAAEPAKPAGRSAIDRAKEMFDGQVID